MEQVAQWLGVWGAVVATSLAGLRFYEAWEGRRKIFIVCSFASIPEVGNRILIQNISSKPLLLTHWDLLWVKGAFWWKEEESAIWGDYDQRDLSIAANASSSLVFAEQNHFRTGIVARKKGKLFLDLYIAGRRRPKRFLLYPKG